MALLNKKERIFDIVLTDRGRDLLSKNQLELHYYAFGDDDIDYSGSLAYATQQSKSLDDFVHRNFSLEVDQYKNRDLQSFLYTVPSNTKVLPEFRSTLDTQEDIEVERHYFSRPLDLKVSKQNVIRQPIAAVMRTNVKKKDNKKRLLDFVNHQRSKQTDRLLESGKNVVGHRLSKEFIALNSKQALNVKTGRTAPIIEVREKQRIFEQSEMDILGTSKDIEIVTGLENKTIGFSLVSTQSEIVPRYGFLIEVFESGSDGKLTKLVESDVVNAAGDSINEGFAGSLNLEVK